MKKSETDIIKSWQKNGSQWIRTIEDDLIQSRKYATNMAIIKAIVEIAPAAVLDVGCGEGWLCRSLSAREIKCTGIDGVQDLIDYANEKGGGEFIRATYEDIVEGKVNLHSKYDLIAFNFSLFGATNTIDILNSIKSNLKENGHILIQTIHPENEAIQKKGKSSQWMTENWDNCKLDCTSFKWYFRTQADWEKAFEQANLKLKSTQTIALPGTTIPFSIIFSCKLL